MAQYDILDGGIPATFTDGPKMGHVGVVTATDGMPPAHLTFLDDLVYTRHAKAKVEATDAYGQPHRYRGVTYKAEPGCPFMVRMRAEINQAQRDLDAGRVETQ